MALVGGLRARLLRESLFAFLYGGLDELGWFDIGRDHLPINFVSTQIADDTEIPLNTLVLADEDIVSSDEELGSLLAENRWTFFVDFFAEDDAVGLDLVRDVRDLVQGRFSSIAPGPTFGVYDWRQATPPLLFSCEIEDAAVDRAHGFTKPWQRFWYSCSFQVIDVFSDDEGIPGSPSGGESEPIVDGGGP